MLPMCSAATLQKCRDMPVRDGDVFIASYPKSGTTWTQNIVFQLLAEPRAVQLSHISDFAPWFEIDSTWAECTSADTGPETDGHKRLARRVFNTHLPWPMMPTGGSADARYLYLVRDGRDVVTSFYHHLSNQSLADGGFDGDWQQFFGSFLAGTLPFGRWRDHLRSWLGPGPAVTVPDERVLVVRYEDMKRDLPVQVARIADHIRAPFAPGTARADELLRRMSFDYMKSNLALFDPRSVSWRTGTDFQFVRKGKIGDHAALFTDAHKRAFEDRVVTAGPAYIRDWLLA